MLVVENCISINTAELRELGLLKGWSSGPVHLTWQGKGPAVGEVALAVDGYDDSLVLRIDGKCFGQPIRQSVSLVGKPMRFGGRRFYLLCPHTGGRCCRMILPPGGVSFQSVAASGLQYRSQQMDALERAYVAIRKIDRKISQLLPRAHAGTRAKHKLCKTEREAYLARLDEYVGATLVSGKRLSMRKAVRSAKDKVH